MEPLNDIKILIALVPEIREMIINGTSSITPIVGDPNISWNDILFFLEHKLVWKNHDFGFFISRNPNITWDIIKNNPSIPWVNFLISRHPNITWDIVRSNPNYPWETAGLLQNPNFSFDILNSDSIYKITHDKFNEIRHSSAISGNEAISSKTIIMHPKFKWDYFEMSNNTNLTPEFIEANIGKNWEMLRLSLNPIINIDLVKRHPEKEWIFGFLSRNPNIIWKNIQENPDLPWNYTIVLKNPNITWEIVQSNRDKFANVENFLVNPNITWNIILGNPKEFNLQENSDTLSLSPVLTWKIILDNPEIKWNWSKLLPYNHFNFRQYSWIDFLFDTTVSNDIKETVTNFYIHPKTFAKFILRVYNPNHPNYFPLLNAYFRKHDPEMKFTITDDDLTIEEVLDRITDLIDKDLSQTISTTADYQQATTKFALVISEYQDENLEIYNDVVGSLTLSSLGEEREVTMDTLIEILNTEYELNLTQETDLTNGSVFLVTEGGYSIKIKNKMIALKPGSLVLVKGDVDLDFQETRENSSLLAFT